MEEIDSDAMLRNSKAAEMSLRLVTMMSTIEKCNSHARPHYDRKIQEELAFLYPQLAQLHIRIRSRTPNDYRGTAGQELLKYFQQQCSAVSTIFFELESIDTRGDLKNWVANERKLEQDRAKQDAKVADSQHSQEEADQSTRTEIETFVFSHADVLTRKRQQLVYKDDYGNEKMDKWVAEIRYFIREVLVPNFELEPLPTESTEGLSEHYIISSGEAVLLISARDLASWVESAATSTNRSFEMSNADELDPIEFEVFVANILSGFGWDTNTTRASGDQGVDVLASSSGKTVAIQCKRYSGPVGNDAVQQVFAGKAHYLATHAAVVTTTNYTYAARQLARSTGVLLLHHSDLADLKKLVGIED